MDEEAGFAALYKTMIDGNLAPEPERAEAALRAVLRLLPGRDPPKKKQWNLRSKRDIIGNGKEG